MTQNLKSFLLYFLIYLILFVGVFHNLISHINVNLLDWLDYALVNWLIFQNGTKITSFNFSNFFDTNAFYPYHNTVFFTDIFLPQTFLGLPLFYLTKNPILIFNVIFILTFILNYISVFIFWNKIFKNHLISFFGSILVIFSPFFHIEISHFQMLSYWPFFFCLYFLFQEKYRKIHIFLIGFFLSIQFLASVYLAVYLLTAIFIFFSIRFLFKPSKINTLKYLASILLIFSILDGIFILGYFKTKNDYSIKRDIKEYITYSAHLSDYLFTTRINSVIHNSPIIEKWNSFDKNNLGGKAAFPGFILTILSIFGIFSFSFKKITFLTQVELTSQKIFFLSLIISGLIFSLGPRLNFNGNYAHIPLPYFLAVKINPVFESTRVPSRWSFIFYLGLTYFALIALTKISSRFPKNNSIILVLLVLALIEYIPQDLKAHSEKYINEDYQKLNTICQKQKKVVLEIPITHLDVVQGIGEGVNYISKVELSSTFHNCFLVNGYSGYDMPQIFELRTLLYQSIEQQNSLEFINILKNKQINYLKINKQHLLKELQKPISPLLDELVKNNKLIQVTPNIFEVIY